jgi:hypothetical protein
MFHLAAFGQSVDLAATVKQLNAVQDQVLTTSGAAIRVPTAAPFLVGYGALCGNTTPISAQIQSPTLREVVQIDVEPLVGALVFANPPPGFLNQDAPVQLTPNEDLNFAMKATGGAATQNYGLVWLSDGPLQPVKGQIFAVAATAAIALAADVWVNGNLTFGQTLPAGRYQVVGMRARGANLVAARLVFVGGTLRPGVAAVTALGNIDAPEFRDGRAGVFGEFDNTTPPTLDALGVTDTAQSLVLDLIKVK